MAWCNRAGISLLVHRRPDRQTDRRTVANARRDVEEEQNELLDSHSQSVNDVFYVDK